MRRLLAVLALVVTVVSPAAAATVDGANIHWTSHGSGGQAVIFVHGWTCDDSSWQGQVGPISRNRRVITLDLPGHGRSGMPKNGFSMELFARAVEAVRADARVDKAVLVGHSMGTPVIRKYALMYPDRVAGLVLVDGLVQIADGTTGGSPPRSPAGAGRENMIRGMFSAITTPVLQQHILKMMMGAPQATADGAMQATWDRTQWSNEPIKAPTLAVYAGARPLSNDASIKQLYPAAEYHQIPQTGHFLMMEKPDEFNALLTRFLDRIR